MQVSQLSRQMEAEARSSRGFIDNTLDNPKNEMCKSIELTNRFVPFETPNGKERKGKKVVVAKKSGEKF